MKKALKNLLCLILLVASVFSFSSCFSNVDMSLPKAVFDEDGNILYNGKVYLSESSIGRPMFLHLYPLAFKNHTLIMRKTIPQGFQVPVYGYGLEDFGEYVYLFNYASMFYEEGNYLKEDFVLPDYWILTIQSISFTDFEIRSSSFIPHEITDKKYDEVLADKVLKITDIVDLNSGLPEAIYCDPHNPIAELLCFIDIYFNEYQTIYLDSAQVYRYSDNLYLSIGDMIYMIKSEYVALFENALNNLNLLTNS